MTTPVFIFSISFRWIWTNILMPSIIGGLLILIGIFIGSKKLNCFYNCKHYWVPNNYITVETIVV